MVKLLLWLVLLFFCWPLALLALVLYPLVWLLLLPFRVVGIAVDGALQLVWALVTLPARVIRAREGGYDASCARAAARVTHPRPDVSC
jgi:hypothetical protein